MHLAQLNIAKMKGPIDSDIMKEFKDNLEPVNAFADAASGFIWRLQDENGDATGFNPFNDPMLIVNMSVWTDISSLKNYMLKTGHVDFLKRRYEWFEKMTLPNHVMWYIPVGHIPTLDEAKERLFHLRDKGETPYAFSIKSKFTAADIPTQIMA